MSGEVAIARRLQTDPQRSFSIAHKLQPLPGSYTKGATKMACDVALVCKTGDDSSIGKGSSFEQALFSQCQAAHHQESVRACTEIAPELA